jgi:stalled ribosome rescue protein Dom34
LKYKRGYPVALLAGLEENCAVLWKVYSNVAKHEKTIPLNGTRKDPKNLYNFHETIINALRPTLKEGVRSIIIASPPKTDYAKTFTDHVRAHHTWLFQGTNKATFSEITGSAADKANVTAMARNPMFRKLIAETTTAEAENLIDQLEKSLNTTNQHTLVLYSLEEIETIILNTSKTTKTKPEHLILTNKHLQTTHKKNRLQRLIQIAQNKKIKTRIVNAETPAGKRLAQLGGIILIAHNE